ncbi:MAG: hypothetical protein FJ109_19895 [Deltaproteobacteria bacterium]|nr:hypothetical protein [Deltaproteobacteria bacterium]
MKKLLVLLAAIALTGCETVNRGNRIVSGIDLLSLGSYQVSGWVPSTPVIRQVLAAADYYIYSWKNTPFQTLVAHAAIIYGGEKQEWWDILPDEWLGEGESTPSLAALPGATLRTVVNGNGNSVTYVYPAGQAPVIDVQLTGDGNTVTVQPEEEEEEE